MRVAFFLQGERVPAARMRGMAVAAELEKQGVECQLHVPYPSVYGDTRLGRPWNRIRPLLVPWVAGVRWRQLRALSPEDIVFFQRPMLELPTVALERRAASGHASVFDFDDAIFLNWGGRKKLRRIAALVDRVIAGNGYLAEAAGVPDKTVVIPTVVDTRRWQPAPHRDATGPAVVVGWTGTAGNYKQLAIASRPIARALKRTGARFMVISDEPPPSALADLQPEFVRWRADTEIADLQRFDIGVMPLPDEPYARGKCAFKLIQYMALARPGIASPVGANAEVVTDEVDGFLPRSDDRWEEHLVRLIQDPDLRAAVGQRARDRVQAAYSLDAVVPRYLALLREVRSLPPHNLVDRARRAA